MAKNRSALIERAVVAYLAQLRNQKDIEIINRNAYRLNRQAKDTLGFQRLPELEERDRRGYKAQPQKAQEFRVWEDAAAWPDD